MRDPGGGRQRRTGRRGAAAGPGASRPRRAASGLLRILAPSLAIFGTVLLTTGAWAMDTVLPGAVLGAVMCLLLLAPVIWSLHRDAERAVASSGGGPSPGADPWDAASAGDPGFPGKPPEPGNPGSSESARDPSDQDPPGTGPPDPPDPPGGAVPEPGSLLEVVRDFEERLSEVAAVGHGVRMPMPARSAEPGVGEAEIARLTHTVNVLLDREEQAAERQRRFATDASHELRTPIAGLRTKIEVALADPEGTDLLGTLRDALTDIERLHQITEDLLALARLDGGPPPDRHQMDLSRMVRAEVDARTPRVPMNTDLQDGVFVDANPPQMSRALANLLSNAERYAEQEIGVSLRAEGDDAVLVVSDDGPGIAAADRERVFDRFARLDSARSRDRGGSGLGLPVAREIVAAHGGRLSVGSSERGARLVLTLPLDRARHGTARHHGTGGHRTVGHGTARRRREHGRGCRTNRGHARGGADGDGDRDAHEGQDD